MTQDDYGRNRQHPLPCTASSASSMPKRAAIPSVTSTSSSSSSSSSGTACDDEAEASAASSSALAARAEAGGPESRPPLAGRGAAGESRTSANHQTLQQGTSRDEQTNNNMRTPTGPPQSADVDIHKQD